MAQKSYRAWLIVLALTGATLDQASKYGVFRWLYNSAERYDTHRGIGEFSVLENKFKLYVQYTDQRVPADSQLLGYSSDRMPRVNHGALFGLLNNHESLANRLFAAISIVAAVGIVGWSFRRHTSRDRLLCCALGLILAGTIGNLYDRLVFGGVRDFLYWYGYEVNWPVFNFADCCLVCGAFLLLAQAFLTHPAPATVPATPESVATPQVAPVQ